MANFNVNDLEFILTQIKMAENNQPPVNPHLAFGLRKVAGLDNSVVPGQGTFGAADQTFPHLTDQIFQNAQAIPGGAVGANLTLASPTQTAGTATSYADITNTWVIDSAPRTISNLISDQTANNAAAVDAQNTELARLGTGYQSQIPNPAFNNTLPPSPTNLEFLPNNAQTPVNVDAHGNLFIPNITPDNGLSAPANQWMAYFGQFFDHGLDLISKGDNGVVFVPLQPDDPLITLGPDGLVDGSVQPDGSIAPNDRVPASRQFMTLTRATNTSIQPGADGVIGTADDIRNNTNTTTPFVDQNQTYSSSPSHQVFLREYLLGSDLKIHSTGRLLEHINGDGSHHMATWADLKASALTNLGIKITDFDIKDVPLLATDDYGNVIRGANGFAQVVVNFNITDTAGVTRTVQALIEGTAAGISLDPPPALTVAQLRVAASDATIVTINSESVQHTGHAFLNDLANGASPFFDGDRNPLTPDVHAVADVDLIAGGGPPPPRGTYDNELLDSHYVAGDGRVNENIGLTAVHEIFHSEHNRLIEATKATVLDELTKGNISFVQNWVLPGANLADGIQAGEWNGERLFQAAKFGTETQYQHLVFEEFARKVAPTIHVFGNVDIHLDSAITSEFANAVYRFGHSMLDENLNRYTLDATGHPVLDAAGNPVLNNIGLIQAFTNPLEYLNRGAGAAGEIIAGTTHQVGNEIDEFVTGALRNNLLGIPLDLAALNIARGRDVGVPPINLVRAQLFHDSNLADLKPYESWADFGNFLKHAASLVNFVAAYGTHIDIQNSTTLAGKRAVALELVQGTHVNLLTGVNDSADFISSRGVYAHNLLDPNAVHSQWSTGDVTGLDHVDLWIGGLAEKQNLFGGLLGSTFNFIFETQLEHLQDGDRLYYLPRVEGTHWGGVIEGNSFTDLIARTTGLKDLPASIFLTPEYTVDADKIIVRDAITHAVLFDGQGHVLTTNPASWVHNAVTGAPLVTVLNDGTIKFLGDDNFLGNTMVLGGTEFDDKLQAGHADDDTVWGYGGNDELDGGGGNDFIYGGKGDDLIHDIAGDDVIHGDEGNDTIYGGIGDDLLFGGDGNDYIDTGAGGAIGDSVVGGLGNDIIVGGEGADTLEGNEGDDWIEGGAAGDGLVGDQGAPTGQQPLIQGNDVLDGGAEGDRMQGFSGDDIMLGQGGFDKFEGRLGFDWASWENETHGIDADLNRREFVAAPGAPAGDAIRDFFIETEAASGTRFDDFILGTNVSKVDTFNELTNTNLIFGLDTYFDPMAGPVAFSGGNILLGGGGSDAITGGGGNDIIDGDARLHVELIGGHHAGAQILREILNDQSVAPTFDLNTGAQLTAGDIDTAVFRDIAANYTVALATDVNGAIIFSPNGSPVLTVTHNTVTAGATNDGTDTLWNIERLQFSDGTIDNPFVAVPDQSPVGALALFDNGVAVGAATVPVVSDVLSFTSTVNDFEGVRINGAVVPGTAGFGRGDIPVADLNLQWQVTTLVPGGGGLVWTNIAGATSATFAPTDFQVGQQLRLMVTYTDGLGHLETVTSTPTAILLSNPVVNHAPTVVTGVASPGLPDTQGREDTALGSVTHPGVFLDVTRVFTDDMTPANLMTYTATLAGTIDGVNVDGNALATLGFALNLVPDLRLGAALGAIRGVTLTGTPPADFAGPIDIRVTATDRGALSVQDTFRINVLPQNDGPALLTIDNTHPTVGTTLHAILGPDPDSSALHPSSTATFQWSLDGVNIFGQNGVNYTPTVGDIGHTLKVEAKYIDGQGFAEDVFSSATFKVFDPTIPAPPQVTALSGTVVEDGPAFTQDLLAGAFDPNGDTISVVGLDATVTTTGGRVLISGTDYTQTGSSFALTAAGFAKFNSLAEGVNDTVVVHFGVTDNGPEVPNTTPNTLTITVQGTNDAPVVTGAVTANAIEGAGSFAANALDNASDVDLGNILSVNNIPALLPAGVTFNALTNIFTLDANNAAYDALRAGQQQTVTVNYGVTDGIATTPGSVSFVVTGTNDAPTDIVVTANAAVVGNNNAPGNGSVIASLAAVDPDLGDPHTFTTLAGSSTAFAVSSAGVITETSASGLANNQTFVLNLQTSDGTATFNETINIQTGTTGNDAAGTLDGSANTDIIYALSGSDTVNGNAGDDTLFGQSGNDILNGGAGNDALYGGNGNDNFIYTSALTAYGKDVINDFTVGPDKIAVGGLGITNANFAARVQVNVVGPDTIVTFDGDTANSIRLVGVTNLGATANQQIGNFNFNPTGLSLVNNNYKVFENAAGAKIDDVVVHDDVGDTHTFVVSDARFEVVDGDLVTPGEQLVLKLKDGVSLNYEAEKFVNIDVSVFDSANQGSLLNPYHFSLQVQDVNEAPTNITPKVASVSENAADGTLVANLSAIDPEGNSIRYSLADTADGRFTLTGNQIRVAHGQILDYETQTAHTINVIATDNHGAQSTETVAINLVNQAETPTITGSDAFDFLFGGSANDRIAAGGGDDYIFAGDGNNYIDGGTGIDNMYGGSGNDTYVVDNVGDVINDTSGSDTVITSLSSYTLAGNLENLINSGSAVAFTGSGNAGDNILRGGAGVDNLYGGGGNDLVIGGAGADTLAGNVGNDQVYGGAGSDNLFGGFGIDKLVGGAGNDTMSGGAGNDVFCFATGFGNDRIMDFDANPVGGQDIIDLKQLGITAANFDGHVTIEDVGADTLVTIDNNPNQTIRFVGIGDATTITKSDFALLGA